MSVRTANLAIVFTDIKGFTERTSQQTLEQNQRLLKAHEAVLLPVFKAFGGRVVKTIGDAFMVTFESPTNAVLAGIAIQDRVWQHRQEAPAEERFEVRVAINVGEVRLEGGDVFGEPVNIAARVEGLADAGEVYFTEAVYLVMNKAEVPSERVGDFELKGIPGKVAVYRVPKAPHRLEAAGLQATVAADQPPYGNLGLARMPDTSKAAELTSMALEQTQAAVRSAVGGLANKAPEALSAMRGLPRKQLGLLAAVVLVLMVGWLALTRQPADVRTIEAVGAASAAERPARLKAARQVIAAEANQGRRHFLEGRLAEAQNESGAANDYQAAVEAGYAAAQDDLLRLLKHERCAFRSAACRSLADLRAKDARSALERLADNGGSDDGQGGVFGFGACDSRRAAKAALAEIGE